MVDCLIDSRIQNDFFDHSFVSIVSLFFLFSNRCFVDRMKNNNFVEIDPSIIYFTHSKIRIRFTGCCKLLEETLEEIKTGITAIESIPKIRVIYDGTRYYSLNNRRLWVFKELNKIGLLDLVKVELKRPESKSEIKLSQSQLSLDSKAILK